MPTPEEQEQELKRDGYTQVAVHKDPPDFEYPRHDHPIDTAYIVLNGDMKIWVEGREYDMKLNDRLDVCKKAEHWSRIGKEGCEFLVGVRI